MTSKESIRQYAWARGIDELSTWDIDVDEHDVYRIQGQEAFTWIWAHSEPRPTIRYTLTPNQEA
jgi:hypothetical protein